jgi:hypothetical protein
VLSPLQQRVALILAELPEAEGFALAGGAALIARGDIDRATRDLDYFATRPERVQEAFPHVTDALQRAGLSVTVERSSDGFVRLTVGDGASTTELDLASDYRLLPAEQSDLGPTLAAEELAIDKVLAIFDRAEPRDFADLAAVVDRWGLEHLLVRAADKDGGFDVRRFGERLDRVASFADEEFRVPLEQVQQVRSSVARWKLQVRLLAQERRPPGP